MVRMHMFTNSNFIAMGFSHKEQKGAHLAFPKKYIIEYINHLFSHKEQKGAHLAFPKEDI